MDIDFVIYFFRDNASVKMFFCFRPSYGNLRWLHKKAKRISNISKFALLHADRNPGGGVPPYMGYIGMCRGIGYGFRGSRSLNRVSFLTLLILCSWCGPLIG